jgi:predicted dehydrogenase
MTQTIGVGILGAGFIGMMHSFALRNLELARNRPPVLLSLVAVADLDARARGRCRDRFGWQDDATEWQAAAEDPRVGLFINAAPNHLHLEPTLAAAHAGKHVFCEKPLAPDADTAFRLWAETARAGVVHQCAFVFRFVPALRLARDIVHSGAIGEVLHFRSSYLMSTALEPGQPMSWRFDRTVAGSGAIGDLGAHHIDQARFIVGEISEVGALGKTQVTERDGRKVEVDDAFVAIARFANGAIGTIEGSRIACGYGHTGRIQVDGTKGSIKFDVERLNELEIADGIGSGFRTIQAIRAGHPFADFWFDAGIQGSHPIGWAECFVHQLHHLLVAVGGQGSVAPLAATFEDGYRAAEICETMVRSWRSGRREPLRYRGLPNGPAPALD